MSLRRSFLRFLAGPPRNRRVARSSMRAARGRSFSLGPDPGEGSRVWRALLWGGVALLLSQIEAGLLPHLDPGAALRIDVPLLVVVFCALQLGAIEGAVAAFVLGWVGDLFVMGPPGLCRFLAVAGWVGVRIAAARIPLPQLLAVPLFTFGAGMFYGVGVLGGVSLVAEGGAGPGTIAWLSVVPQAALTALAALPLHAALGRLEAATGVQGESRRGA
jgi:hypothetical protein